MHTAASAKSGAKQSINTGLESLCAVLLRSLSQQAHAQWSGQTLYLGTQAQTTRAAHQHTVPMQLPTQRALIDGLALRLRYSDANLHAAHTPSDSIEHWVYELLEQLRVESVVPSVWPGVITNLHTGFRHWTDQFSTSELVETDLGILLFTVAMMTWSRLNSQALPETIADLIETTRGHIGPELGPFLSALRKDRSEQAAFQKHALQLAKWLGQTVRHAQSEASNTTRQSRTGSFTLHLPQLGEQTQANAAVHSQGFKSWQKMSTYHVFTTAYDRQASASELVRHAQLEQFRAQIDDSVRHSGLSYTRLARYLQHHLAIPQCAHWNFVQEQGLIDSQRLPQLISNPLHKAIFKTEAHQARLSCAVTILLDCSGSMKSYFQPLSVVLDVLGRALCSIGVTLEVLGFSTRTWNGGRALRDWRRSASPSNPGRLNEGLHLVFKSAQQPWQRARLGMAALCKLDLYREGMEGEALAWACTRLRQQNVQRRIVLVVSDGCPMDTATHSHNGEYYLEQHLRQVIVQQEQAGDIALRALGLGLDLGGFYRHNLALDLQEDIDQAALMAIAALLVH